jgi:protein-S-isoprenylcysteine O-methyltransferase Ste14
MRLVRQLAAVVLLPGTVAVLIPALLLRDAEIAPWPLALVGGAVLAFGLFMIAWTVALFAGVGRGTLAPWDPPERLVVRGPYRYVRNPMITGVVSVLLGEAALFASPAVLAWAGFVFALNAVYFPLIEEPDLRSRFGSDYDEYAASTPRWLPRYRRTTPG